MIKINSIRLNMLKNPLGIHGMPKLSWATECDGRNLYQDSYEIQISEKEDFVDCIKDTGRVKSGQSVHVAVKEVCLQPLTKYYVRIKVWLNDNTESDWSKAEWFITAPDVKKLKASFITAERKEDEKNTRGTVVQKTFRINKAVKSAYVCATALGIYYLYINHRRISDYCLCPGWTDYKKRVLYQIYEVTDILQSQENSVRAMLGAGWYKGTIGFYEKCHNYGTHAAFWFQLEINYMDGTHQTICTDESWEGAYSQVMSSEIYNGEVYDASYTIQNWMPVRKLMYPTTVLDVQAGCMIRKHESFYPAEIFYTPKGELCVDFKQNMAGWVKIKVKASKGEKCRLHFFEVLDKDGNAYFDNLREAQQTDCYICGGNGEEVYEPFFTFHGFRYVMVEEWPGELRKEMMTAYAIHSDMEMNGNFSCSDELINQLCHNILWGMKSNFVDIPMDCPQRDERLGWTGDAQIFCGTAAGFMNVSVFFEKWLKDLEAEQYPDGGIPHVIPDVITGRVSKGDLFEAGTDSASGWADAAVIIPWQMYLHYGDKDIIKSQFKSMKAWIDFMRIHSEDYVFKYKLQFGDWVALDAYEGSYFGATPVELTSMAYYAYVTDLFSKMAYIIGEFEISEQYRQLYEKIKIAFQSRYFDSEGSMTVMTQTAHVLALYFKLVPMKYRQKISNKLVELIEKENGHLVTGFMGTPYICFALSDNGHEKEAAELLLKKDFPSWLYQVEKGATTVWEHWDGIKDDGTMWSSEMNSFNHYAYGAVGEWLFRRAAGLEPIENAVGFKCFKVEPMLALPFNFVSYTLKTLYGEIFIRWEKNDDLGKLYLKVPINTNAFVNLSVFKIIKAPGLNFKRINGVWEAKIGSGEYEVDFEM